MSDHQPPFGEPPETSRGVRYVWPNPNASRRSRVTARLVFGLAIFTLGVLWTLDNLNILEAEPIVRWWPAILVLVGLARLFGFGRRRQPVAGTVFTVIGLLLLAREFDLASFHISQLWPLAIIALGAMLVVRSLRGPSPVGSDSSADPHDQVHSFAMWAGSNIKNESQDFRGGELSAVMGGVDLDLRGTRTTVPSVVIDVFAWWGGIDIKVPRDWRVVSEVTPFMGGIDDKSAVVQGDAVTTLVLRGVVIMGGVEIKN